MPFRSKKQMRFLAINHPKIYMDWMSKYGPYKETRRKVRGKKKQVK
jgi:hypothetical protein